MLNQPYVQVGVYSRNSSVLKSARKGLEPSLRLPFMCIFAPQCFVRVACAQVEDNRRAFRDGNFGDDAAVLATNRFGERQNSVRASPGRVM